MNADAEVGGAGKLKLFWYIHGLFSVEVLPEWAKENTTQPM